MPERNPPDVERIARDVLVLCAGIEVHLNKQAHGTAIDHTLQNVKEELSESALYSLNVRYQPSTYEADSRYGCDPFGNSKHIQNDEELEAAHRFNRRIARTKEQKADQEKLTLIKDLMGDNTITDSDVLRRIAGIIASKKANV